MPQDLPPSGGYEPVQFKRNIPFRGVPARYYIFAMGLVCTYGMYYVGKGNREGVELAREKTWARIYLVPLLQAEEDRDQVRRMWANQKREEQLLGDKNFKVYNSDRFIRPTFAVLPPFAKEK